MCVEHDLTKVILTQTLNTLQQVVQTVLHQPRIGKRLDHRDRRAGTVSITFQNALSSVEQAAAIRLIVISSVSLAALVCVCCGKGCARYLSLHLDQQ